MASITLASVLGLLLVIATVAEGGPRRKIVVLERIPLSTMMRWTKDGKTGAAPAAGVTQVFVSDILNPATKAKIGTDTGCCIYTYETINICTLTTNFKDGSITVSGAIDDKKTVQDIAIVGGTGAYVGAKGVLNTSFVSETKTVLTMRQEFNLM